MNNKKKNELRFAFGKNWQLFLSTLTENKIDTAKKSLISLMGVKDLNK